MDNPRLLVFILICLIALQIWIALVAPPPPEEPAAPAPSTETIAERAEARRTPSGTTEEEGGESAYPDRDPIVIETGVYHIEFDVRGARPIRWEITDPAYASLRDAEDGETTEGNHFFPIIPHPPAATGINTTELPLQVELARWGGVDREFNTVNWQVVRGPETDESGAIHLGFESPERDGLIIGKHFVFHPADSESADLAEYAGGFVSDLTITLRNVGEERIVLDSDGTGLRLTWGPGIGEYEQMDFYNVRTPLALVEGDTWYQSPSENKSRRIATSDPTGVTWAGLQSRYFMATLIPTGDQAPTVARVLAELRPENTPSNEDYKRFSPLQTVSLVHPALNLAPGAEQISTYQLYVGPTHRPHLLAAGHDLARANFYSSWFWMRWLCILMTHLLNFFHGVVGNYGWAILLLTVTIRLIMYPLTHKQLRIMAQAGRDMQRIKPHLQAVREKYKDDFMKIQRETQKVYKEHGVNPYAGMKGCLPLLIQMPFLFALFIMLRSLVELRGADWLWINDLSGPDRLFDLPWLANLPLIGWVLGDAFNLMPLLMAGTQVLMMKLSPTRVDDPTQRTMMMIMPVMLTVMLYRAPSGLMLYWVAGNIWQMGHQLLTNRAVMHEEATGEPASAEAGEGRPSDRGIGKAKDRDEKAKGDKSAKSRSAILAEKRREAAEARKRSVAESKSLPRWMRRGGA